VHTCVHIIIKMHARVPHYYNAHPYIIYVYVMYINVSLQIINLQVYIFRHFMRFSLVGVRLLIQ